VKRKKSIELSKGESLSLYRREHEAQWKSMEAYGLEIPVASEKLCMSLRELVSQFADFQCICDFLPGHIVAKLLKY